MGEDLVKIGLTLKSIGISLIGVNERGKRTEIGYLHLKGMEVNVTETMTLRTLQMKIAVITLDNNI